MTRRTWPEPCSQLVDGEECGERTTYRYPAMDGGFAYLCERHGETLAEHAEHIDRGHGVHVEGLRSGHGSYTWPRRAPEIS